MKKIFLIISILIFSAAILSSFRLSEFAENNDVKWEYDPYSNILTLQWRSMDFKFLPYESFYYQGIRVFRMTDPVLMEGTDFLIPDEFAARWKVKKGIFDIKFTQDKKRITVSILSDIPMKYTYKSKKKIFQIQAEAPCFLEKDYYYYPEMGIEYIKIVNSKDLELRFNDVEELKEYQPSEDKLMISYIYDPPKAHKKDPVIIRKSSDPVKFSRKKVCIIIDPGHGGKDPGAIGITGVKEKTIVLALSKKLRSYLEKMGYSVLMTREKDIFIPLRNRPKFANSNNGDLFISLHANFAYNPKVKGFDIYYLSKSASDDESREVAAYENNVIKLEREHKQDMLGEIIWSMMSNEFENESITLAGMVSRDLKKITPANGNPVKHARFYVLYGATMPAILIESGFISNRSEARNLVKANHQDKLTKSIAEAIDAYIVKNYRKFINGN